MRRAIRIAAACAPLVLAGCTGDSGGAAPPARSSTISDQLHNGGTRGFMFLPPMVPRPGSEGENVWGLSPTVRIDEICAVGSTTCVPGTTIRTLAQFTATSGPRGERIRTHRHGHECDRDDDDRDDDDDDYYYARWDTDDAHLSLTALYRVRVFIPAAGGGTRELGFADVDVVRSAREFRSVDTQNFAPLVNGSKLRIKFRLERAAVDGDGDGRFDWVDNCATVSNASQLDTDRDGKGDACECLGVTCAALDPCHVVGTCAPTTGACSNPNAADGSACSLAHASAACSAGVCRITSCVGAWSDHDTLASTGCEFGTDPSRCGAMTSACAAPASAIATCTTTGDCDFACVDAFHRCGGACASDTSVASCGASCAPCPTPTNAAPTCDGTSCGFACNEGFADCDNASPGCETSVLDVHHCGGCSNDCFSPPVGSHATATCGASGCGIVCTDGYADCNHDPADGCEVSAATDPLNCGGCGTACGMDMGTVATCSAGHCGTVACAADTGNCDNDPRNGCETDVVTASNCGICGRACSFANAVAACSPTTTGPVCGFSACDANYGDCDGVLANGCEATLDTVDHCGACENRCVVANGTPSCTGGTCGVAACDPGFVRVGDACVDLCAGVTCAALDACHLAGTCDRATGTCSNPSAADGTSCSDGNACNGAEACASGLCVAGAPLSCGSSDPCHVGTCDPSTGCQLAVAADGTACSDGDASTIDDRCALGVCVGTSCPAGLMRCGGVCLDTQTSPSNCGGCGSVCGTGLVCTGGACVPSCASTNTTANCGTCGHACSVGQACVSGACVNTACTPIPPCSGPGCAVCSRVVYTENWESGAGGWRSVDGNPVVVASESAPCAGRFLHEAILYSGGRVFTTAPIPVVGGRTYCITSWVRSGVGTQPFLGIEHSNAAGARGIEHWLIGNCGYENGYGGVVAPLSPDGVWRWYSDQFTMTPGVTHVLLKVEIFSGGAAGASDFDQIQLIEGPCPTAPASICAAASCP